MKVYDFVPRTHVQYRLEHGYRYSGDVFSLYSRPSPRNSEVRPDEVVLVMEIPDALGDTSRPPYVFTKGPILASCISIYKGEIA